MKSSGISPAGVLLVGAAPSERINLPNYGRNYILCASPEQPKSLGNSCGHNKNDPQFTETHRSLGRFPKIIDKTHSRLPLAYTDPDKYWWSLNFLDNRQKRSERREACIKVGLCLNLHNDLRHFTTKMTALDISSFTGLSLSRIKQALKDLARAGYVKTVNFLKHCFQGAWYGIVAERQLQDKFYIELGISDHAIYSARCHKAGYKMPDTRKEDLRANFVATFAGNLQKPTLSSVNMENYPMVCIYTPSVADEIAEKSEKGEEAENLVKKARELAKETGESFMRILIRLQKESPPST